MNIALYHNYYKSPGGEDQIFEIECRALRQRGHQVFPFAVSNGMQMKEQTALQTLQVGWMAPFNTTSFNTVASFLDEVRPDVAHVHNWFPILSPSVYKAYFDRAIPVIQTLHNYRMGCATGNYRYKNQACTDCLTQNRWASVRKSCYQGNPVGSYLWKRVMDQNWKNGTFKHPLLHYICPSVEVYQRHLEMGVPGEKMTIVPNACEDPLAQQQGEYIHEADAETHVIFIGRLVPEKGIQVLLEAWKKLKTEVEPGQEDVLGKAHLSIVGDGPDMQLLKDQCRSEHKVHFHGSVKHEVAMRILRSSSVLVFPSLWAEPFGLGIIEAMGAGKAVIASRKGGPADLVEHNESGLLIPEGNTAALVSALRTLLLDRQRCKEMGNRGRRLYQQQYGPAAHALALEKCYAQMMNSSEKGAA